MSDLDADGSTIWADRRIPISTGRGVLRSTDLSDGAFGPVTFRVFTVQTYQHTFPAMRTNAAHVVQTLLTPAGTENPRSPKPVDTR